MPRTATEIAVAAVWTEVLGLEQVDADQDFFDIGGRSLLAVRVVTEIHHRLGLRIPLEAVFDYPTIREIARYVDEYDAPSE